MARTNHRRSSRPRVCFPLFLRPCRILYSRGTIRTSARARTSIPPRRIPLQLVLHRSVDVCGLSFVFVLAGRGWSECCSGRLGTRPCRYRRRDREPRKWIVNAADGKVLLVDSCDVFRTARGHVVAGTCDLAPERDYDYRRVWTCGSGCW